MKLAGIIYLSLQEKLFFHYLFHYQPCKHNMTTNLLSNILRACVTVFVSMLDMEIRVDVGLRDVAVGTLQRYLEVTPRAKA